MPFNRIIRIFISKNNLMFNNEAGFSGMEMRLNAQSVHVEAYDAYIVFEIVGFAEAA